MAYVWRGPTRGDIVAVWNGREVIVKRVIGLPGEEISAEASTFFVNGAPIQEPYVESHAAWNVSSGRMPDDEFVLAGDNRADSVVLVVHRDRIVGRVLN
jgi:signal peptidase I